MIEVTKKEKELIVSLYPKCKIVRTMKQDSHRHHYYCPESEDYMRVIMDTNDEAAAIVREFDRIRQLRNARAARHKEVGRNE